MTPKKKRLYIIILVCAVGAMIIDRLAVGYSPEKAMASDAPRVAVILDTSDAAVMDSIPELPFPHFIEVSGQDEFVDFFTPPSLRHQFAATAQQNVGSDIDNNQKNSATSITDYLTFESTYTLDAVMLSPKFHVAIVNGSWIQLGQTLGGCTLIEITDNIARFNCSDETATLRVINLSTLLQD